MRRVVLALRVWAQETEAGLGVSGAQLFVLQKLDEEAEQSVNSLAQRTMTSKSSVSVVVSRLVARGLVKRRPSPDDGRSVRLTLTAAGRALVERGPESAQGRVIAALGRLPQDELAMFARLFDRFVVELGVKTLEPTMLFETISAAGRRKPGRPPRPTQDQQTRRMT